MASHVAERSCAVLPVFPPIRGLDVLDVGIVLSAAEPEVVVETFGRRGHRTRLAATPTFVHPAIATRHGTNRAAGDQFNNAAIVFSRVDLRTPLSGHAGDGSEFTDAL